jgi:hypothetical protein
MKHLLYQVDTVAHRPAGGIGAEVVGFPIRIAAIESEPGKSPFGQYNVRVRLVVTKQDVVARGK